MRVALLLLLAGCPRPIPPPPPNPPAEIPICFMGTHLFSDGACADSFTVDGLACAVCVNAKGCYEPVNVIYCADTCADPRCAPADHWSKK